MDLKTLKAQVNGLILTSESEGYDKARIPWELALEQRPKVIVMAQDADDIAAAVLFAGANGLKVGVMNTGHGLARPADDNLLINVSEMNGVEINEEKETAVVEAGAVGAEVLARSQDYGLAPLLGSSSHVGVVGFSLGGGMGWLARKHGLAQNSVLAYELVTGLGQKIRVSKEAHPDLFWGLKGGGASFGIVTAMEIQLYPVDQVYAGTLFYSPHDAREVFSRYREWAKGLPDDWTTSVSIGNFPDDPMLPEPLQGKSMVMVRGCYAGPAAEGETDLKPWLEWKEPLMSTFGPLSFRESDRISEDPKDPLPVVLTSLILNELSDDVIDTLVLRGIARNGPSPLLMAEIHQGGGAMAKADRSMMANRLQDAPWILKFLGLTASPELKTAFQNILDAVKFEIKPYCSGGAFLNFLNGEEKWNGATSVFSPESLKRLMDLKQTYDPNNLFSFNMNLAGFIPDSKISLATQDRTNP